MLKCTLSQSYTYRIISAVEGSIKNKDISLCNTSTCLLAVFKYQLIICTLYEQYILLVGVSGSVWVQLSFADN